MCTPEITIIMDYYKECLFEPDKNWPEYYFCARSYSRWAANEIIDRICYSDDNTPRKIIEDFIDDMDRMACLANEKKHMFVIAMETGKDILGLFS